jgi:DNA helicase-2/ATP-dependent DNA helicase PcrA
MFNPSPQQSNIFSAIERGDENLSVKAVAGSGTKRIPRGSALLAPSIVFLAFNKSIAETLQTRLPRGVQSSTFHSLGFRALKNSSIVERNVKVDGRKCAKLVWNAMGETEDTRATIQLVSLAKSRWPTDTGCTMVDRTHWWQDIIKHHDVVVENPMRAIEVAAKVLEKSNETLDVIDFDDMLYLPVLHNAHFDQQDWIFVDEAQDTNDIQLEILDRLQRPTAPQVMSELPEDHPARKGLLHGAMYSRKSPTRLCAVGDPHQAIYGFRGANSDSMSRIASRFSCKTYPLSVSYRCSRRVVEEAQKYLCQERTV